MIRTASRDLSQILLVVVASLVTYLAETWLIGRDLLPWGAEGQGILAVLGGTFVAIALLYRSGEGLADIGLVRPKRWWTVPIWALAIVVAFIVAQIIVPIFLSPFFIIPQPDFSRYGAVHGNVGAALMLALILPLTAAIPEEILYRGFLMKRLTGILGEGSWRSLLVILVQGLIFGSVHFQWGLGGVLMTSIMGMVWGAGYWLCGRNLWITIIAHSLLELLLVGQLYVTPPA